MDSRLYVIKGILGGMARLYKNYPNQMDESLHGSWANQSGPKVEDTQSRSVTTAEQPAKAPAEPAPRAVRAAVSERSGDNDAVPKAIHALDVLPILNDPSNQGYRTKLRSLMPDADVEEMGVGEDPLMEELIVEQGFDAKPHLVDAAELDKYVADGEIELFRGIKDENGIDYAEAFRTNDKVYAALGRMGSGIYTKATVTGADGKVYRGDATAKMYAQVDQNATNPGKVLRMSIKKGAKVVPEADLLREMHAAHKEYTAKIKDMEAKYGKKMPPEQDKEYNRLQDIVMGITCNPGRFAAAKGYDAVMGMNDNVLVINRGALRVQKTNW